MVILMKFIRIILLLCTALPGLSACGQKGPLYLPAPEKSASDKAH